MAPLFALLIPVGILIGQFLFTYGWLEMALGRLAIVFWIAVVIWMVALVLSLRRRQWWALLGAPLVLYPVGLSALLLVACAKGDCL